MEVFEYRGVEDMVIAEVTKDDNEENGGYVTGPVEPLIPVAEVGKTTETSSETKYYDNKPAIVIDGEGPDTITITGAGIPLKKKAHIIGKSYDETTGALVDGPRQTRYFALGYKTQDTDGYTRFVWRYKGTFGIPDENAKTVDGGTETNNTTLTFTGIMTNHKFAKGKLNGTTWEPAPAKGLVVSDREGLADLTNFFTKVTTPDDLTAKKAG